MLDVDDPYYAPIDDRDLIEAVVKSTPEDVYYDVPSETHPLFGIPPGEIIDNRFEGEEMLDPQTKLQLILRKVYEYRILNSLEATNVRWYADTVTFLSLLLSGISSILLLGDYSNFAGAIAATLTAIITALTGYQSYMQFSGRYEKHTASTKEFANLQRTITMDLKTLDDEKITENFEEYTSNLGQAVASMPLVEQETIMKYRKDGERMFRFISDIDRWNESVENIKSIGKLDIFRVPSIYKGTRKNTLDQATSNFFDKLKSAQIRNIKMQ